MFSCLPAASLYLCPSLALSIPWLLHFCPSASQYELTITSIRVKPACFGSEFFHQSSPRLGTCQSMQQPFTWARPQCFWQWLPFLPGSQWQSIGALPTCANMVDMSCNLVVLFSLISLRIVINLSFTNKWVYLPHEVSHGLIFFHSSCVKNRALCSQCYGLRIQHFSVAKFLLQVTPWEYPNYLLICISHVSPLLLWEFWFAKN